MPYLDAKEDCNRESDDDKEDADGFQQGRAELAAASHVLASGNRTRFCRNNIALALSRIL